VTEEIERKFVPAAVPDVSAFGPGVGLRQGYLAQDGAVEVRLRTADSRTTLTVKAGTGLARTEVELPVSPEQAEALWPSTATRRIDKTRYRVAIGDPGGHTAEVDVYLDALAGLCVVEVEFASRADAAGFVPPDWFGREVTGEPGWSNAALARHGRPD
jgi:CYTH domain-containing protein